jgi:hypothetical protein
MKYNILVERLAVRNHLGDFIICVYSSELDLQEISCDLN